MSFSGPEKEKRDCSRTENRETEGHVAADAEEVAWLEGAGGVERKRPKR